MIDLSAYFDDQIAELQEAKAQYEANLTAKYAEGYADGKASVVLPTPGTGELLFTQDDMGKLAATAKAEKDAEYQPQLVALNQRVDELVLLVDGIDLRISGAVSSARKDIAAKMRNTKVDDEALIQELEQ